MQSSLPAGLVDVERFLCAFDQAQRCPYCHAELELDRAPLAACDLCKTLLHSTCAIQHGGCTTSGCRRAPTGTPRPEAPRGRPVAPVRVAPLVGLVALAGAGAWFLGLQLSGLFHSAPSPGPPAPPWREPPPPAIASAGLQLERIDVGPERVELVGRLVVDGPARPELMLVAGGYRLSHAWVPGTERPWVATFAGTLAYPPGQRALDLRLHHLEQGGIAREIATQSLQVVIPPQPRAVEPVVVSIGSAPGQALVAIQAPELTDSDTVLLRGRVRSVERARISLAVDGAESFTWDSQAAGEFQGAVTVSGRGRHTIQVTVTLPDGRSGTAACAVVRRG